MERCGGHVRVTTVFVGKMKATGSSWEGFRWRNAGDRFGCRVISFNTCEPQVRVRRVFVEEMGTTGSS